MEEYKKKYKELVCKLNKAKEEYGNFTFNSVIYSVIPEPAESVDEKIRKDIVSYIAASHKDVGEKVRWLYWLEKQGKQKHIPDWMPKFLDELRSKKNYFDWDEHKDIEGHILAIIKWMNPNYFNEKDGEQTSDKVESKFKVGDKIYSKKCKKNIAEIDTVGDNGYLCKDGRYVHFDTEDEWDFHPMDQMTKEAIKAHAKEYSFNIDSEVIEVIEKNKKAEEEREYQQYLRLKEKFEKKQV